MVAVAVRQMEMPVVAAAAAGLRCRGVLVRRPEDVPGLVGEGPVDLVRSPVAVEIAHDDLGVVADRVGEVAERVLGEERDIGPVGVEGVPELARVGAAAGASLRQPEAGQHRVAPGRLEGLEIARGDRRHADRDRPDMVREGDVLRRRHVGEIGQRLLDLGADLEPLRRGDRERGRRTGDDDQPDGDPAGEPARQRPAAGFLAGAGLRRRLVRARERLGVAARLAPRPPLVRAVGLRGAKAFGVAEPQRLDAEPFRLVEVGLGEGERSRTGLLVRQVQDRQAPVLVQAARPRRSPPRPAGPRSET